MKKFSILNWIYYSLLFLSLTTFGCGQHKIDESKIDMQAMANAEEKAQNQTQADHGGLIPYDYDSTRQIQGLFSMENFQVIRSTMANEMLFCLSMDGTICGIDIRSRKAMWKIPSQFTYDLNLIANGNELYYGNNELICRNQKDGKQLWTFTIEGKNDFTDLIVGDSVIAFLANSKINFLNRFTGKEQYKLETSGTRLSHIQFCDHKYYFVDDSKQFFEFDLSSKSSNVIASEIADFIEPLVIDNKVYACVCDPEYNGRTKNCKYKFCSIDLSSKKVNWKIDINKSISAKPIMIDDGIVFRYYENIICVDKNTGTELWHMNLTHNQEMTASIYKCSNKLLLVTGMPDNTNFVFVNPKSGATSSKTDYLCEDFFGPFEINGKTYLLGSFNSSANGYSMEFADISKLAQNVKINEYYGD